MLQLVVKHTFLQLEESSRPLRRCNSEPSVMDMAELSDHYSQNGTLVKMQTYDLDEAELDKSILTYQKAQLKLEAQTVKSERSDTSTRAGSDDNSPKPDAMQTEMPPVGDEKTTVMLRNVPSNYSRAKLMDLLQREGFGKSYDFLYVPIQFSSNALFGYAFINLVDNATMIRFWNHFQNFTRWGIPSDRVAEVTWSWKHQGLAQHIERYRNSPVMHESMPEECKPVIMRNGVRIPFPPPTKRIQQPRLRTKASR
eukprot:gb/GFBE01054970.1/.p1 GENE.gb/GFBE01054970.1/~~gb/GFBE01054970.1/.p1  ORF type:complete len:254 (+),score=63.71 gb/GFBE01054970.1/:1-762(+)